MLMIVSECKTQSTRLPLRRHRVDDDLLLADGIRLYDLVLPKNLGEFLHEAGLLHSVNMRIISLQCHLLVRSSGPTPSAPLG